MYQSVTIFYCGIQAFWQETSLNHALDESVSLTHDLKHVALKKIHMISVSRLDQWFPPYNYTTTKWNVFFNELYEHIKATWPHLLPLYLSTADTLPATTQTMCGRKIQPGLKLTIVDNWRQAELAGYSHAVIPVEFRGYIPALFWSQRYQPSLFPYNLAYKKTV